MHAHLCLASCLSCSLPRLTVLLPALPDVYLSAQREVQVQPPVRLPLGDRGHIRLRDTPHIFLGSWPKVGQRFFPLGAKPGLSQEPCQRAVSTLSWMACCRLPESAFRTGDDARTDLETSLPIHGPSLGTIGVSCVFKPWASRSCSNCDERWEGCRGCHDMRTRRRTGNSVCPLVLLS